jgi:hypothetical protein
MNKLFGALSGLGDIAAFLKAAIQAFLARAFYVAGENKQENRDLQGVLKQDEKAKEIDDEVDHLSRDELIARYNDRMRRDAGDR